MNNTHSGNIDVHVCDRADDIHSYNDARWNYTGGKREKCGWKSFPWKGLVINALKQNYSCLQTNKVKLHTNERKQ